MAITQMTLFGKEEVVEPSDEIIKRNMRLVNAEGVTEEQYNRTVVWLAALEYSGLWDLMRFAADAKRCSRGDEWVHQVRAFLLNQAKDKELPNTETLNRTLRDIKKENKLFVTTQEGEQIERTL